MPRSAPVARDSLDDEPAVLLEQRVRLVVRERAVGLEVAALGLDRQAAEDRLDHRAGHAVGAVDHDVQRRDRRDVDDDEAACRRSPAARRAGRARRAGPACEVPGQRAVAHLVEPPVAAHGQTAAPHHLHAVVLLRIVRRGDDQAAVVAVLADGVIEHLRAARGRSRRRRAAVERAPGSRPPRAPGDVSRMSWPIADRRGSNSSTYARTMRYAPSASSSSGTMPRTSYALKTDRIQRHAAMLRGSDWMSGKPKAATLPRGRRASPRGPAASRAHPPAPA